MHESANRRKSRGLVTILLPAKNEEQSIARTLRSLPLRTLDALGYEVEVLVLDGNSQDETARIAAQWGATVITDTLPGKGNAVRHAISHMRGRYAVMLDADGTYPPDAIPRILAPLERDEADVVMGTRVPRPGSMKGVHLIGNAMLSVVASVLFVRTCPDLCTGLWGFRTDALRRMRLASERFGLEAELFALSTRLGHRVARVETDYLPRNGQPKLTFGHDGLRIVRRLMISRFAPIETVRNTARAAPSAGEVGA